MDVKKIFLLVLLSLFVSAGFAQSHRYQKGYVRKNGTYVSGHYKTRSDKTNHNNFSTKGNRNPYTSSKGRRAKDYSSGAYNYGRGKVITKGPKGGQSYKTTKGTRTYVPKRF